MSSRWAVVLLVLAGTLAYGNTAKNGLFWDDDEFIKRNIFIRSFSQFPNWFTKPLTAGAGVNSNYYRPLLMASFTIDYHLWGLWPAGYHLENILWHTFAAVLVFIFLREVIERLLKLKTPTSAYHSPLGSIRTRLMVRCLADRQNSKLKSEELLTINHQSSIIAFSTALLWLVHPIHTEAVAYANSRGDSMATVFILLSLILWLKNRIRESVIAFILALLSKEFSIITPGLMALLSFVNLTNRKFTKLPFVKNLLIVFSIAALYVLLRLTTLNFQNTLNFYGVDLSHADRTDPVALYATSTWTRALTFLKVLPIYFKLLIWPGDLHVERTVDIPASIFDPAVLSAAGVLVVIGLLVYWSLIILKQRLPLFAASWFFIAILPVSGVIPISQILAEHFLYLPSIGFSLLVGLVIVTVTGKLTRVFNDSNHLTYLSTRTAFVITILLSISLLLKTVSQNRVWRDPITFYEYTLAHAQPTLRVHNNLAMAYADTKDHEKAIEHYVAAIALGDSYPNPHYNLANTYVELGELPEAEEEYKKALQIDPNFHYATVSLGKLYLSQGRTQEAISLVCPVLPTQPLCR